MHAPPCSSLPAYVLNTDGSSNALRERALELTTEALRAFDKIRRDLELPIEHLPIVIETFSRVVAELVAERTREELALRTSREPLTMRSTNRDFEPMKIRPGKITEVIARPQAVAFRAEDFAIHGDRARWLVHDIKVGHRSQFVQKRGPAAGTEFGPGGICEHLRLEVCQTAMDLTLVVEYVGSEEDGEVFEATVVGTSVMP